MIIVPIPEQALAALQQTAFQAEAFPLIRTIAMVGAVLHDKHLGPWEIDTSILAGVFNICAKQSIPLAPAEELIIGVVNLDYGHDVLKEPPKADAVIFSNIFYEPASIGRHIFTSTKQSDLAAKNNVWHDALLRTGAKIAFNVYFGSGEDELPTQFLTHEPYSLHGAHSSHYLRRGTFDLLMR